MASMPDCRVASAAFLPDPIAGFPGVPISSAPSLSLTADASLQQQLDELAAMNRRPRGFFAPLWPTVREPPLPPASGDFLLFPEIQQFQDAVTLLEAECGTPLWTTQRRLTRLRLAVCALRERREQGGVRHVCH